MIYATAKAYLFLARKAPPFSASYLALTAPQCYL